MLDPRLVLYLALEAHIQSIRCHAILLVGGEFYMRMAKCRDRVLVTELLQNVAICSGGGKFC